MNKRQTVYLQSPRTYDMAGCSCGNNNPEWSEYQKHLWCSKCKIDFIPEHGGILEGLIQPNVCKMFGINFSRLVLATNTIEVLNDEGKYVECLNIQDVITSRKIPVKISENEHGIIDYKNNTLECNSEATNLKTEMIFDYPSQDKFTLTWNKTATQFLAEPNEDLRKFHQYMLKKDLELNLSKSLVRDKKAKI